MESIERLKVLRGHLNPTPREVGGNQVSGLGLNPEENRGTFRYTSDLAAHKLSLEQRRFYEENGYLVIRNLVSPKKLDRYKERFMQICSGEVETPPGMIVMKDVSLMKMGVTGEKVINKVQDYIYDPVLFNYCQLPEVLDYVQCFTGPNIMAMHTMLISKPPDPGTLSSRHPLHQDQPYFPFGPPHHIVCSWTAMEPVTRENGCLVVLPGTHHGQVLNHKLPEWEGGVNKFYYGIEGLTDKDFEKRIHLEMGKGDTVFFHPILIHGSGTNRTDGFRKAISCHYAASECNYSEFSEDSSSVDLYKDIKKLVASRYNVELEDPSLIWRVRSRLVRGEKINL